MSCGVWCGGCEICFELLELDVSHERCLTTVVGIQLREAPEVQDESGTAQTRGHGV